MGDQRVFPATVVERLIGHTVHAGSDGPGAFGEGFEEVEEPGGVTVAGDEQEGGILVSHLGRADDEHLMLPRMPAPRLRGQVQSRGGETVHVALLHLLPCKRSIRLAHVVTQRIGRAQRDRGEEEAEERQN